MSQQLLQCSGSLRSYAVCLKHPVLLELTPQCTSAHSRTLSHILPGTYGLVFPDSFTFNEEEKVSRGRRTACVCIFEFLMRTLQLYLKLSTKSFKLGFSTILDPSIICKLSPSW